MNVVKEIERINEREAELGITGSKASWHERYRSSAWIYAGGLGVKLSEGDVICVFSQWGEIEDIHLARDEETGKSKGFAFIKYEDQRSTDLAVDNFNGVKLLGRTLRVDHKLDYNAPKKKKEDRDGTEGPVKYEPGKSYVQFLFIHRDKIVIFSKQNTLTKTIDKTGMKIKNSRISTTCQKE